jgi:hypothetical protein
VLAAAVRRALARRGAKSKRIPFLSNHDAALTPQASRVKLSAQHQGQQGTVYRGELEPTAVVIKALTLGWNSPSLLLLLKHGPWEAAVQAMALENADAIEEVVMLCLLMHQGQGQAGARLGPRRVDLLGLCVEEVLVPPSSSSSSSSSSSMGQWQVVLVSAQEPATLKAVLEDPSDRYLLQHPSIALGIALDVARALCSLHEQK